MSPAMTEQTWSRFVEDPGELGRATSTELFSLDPKTVEAIQVGIAGRSFARQVQAIPALARLAEANGIQEIGALDDLAPLLPPHTTYKTYPMQIIEEGDYGRLTRWWSMLNSHDLSALPSAACRTFDDWLIMMERAGLPARTSSGTTGTTTLLPLNRRDASWLPQSYFVYLHQGFGDEPLADHSLKRLKGLPCIHLTYRRGPGTHDLMIDQLVDQLYGGDEGMVHALNRGRLSADAKARNRGGAAGAAAAAADSQGDADAFFAELADTLRGRAIIGLGHWPRFYEAAILARRRGLTRVFGGGFIVGGGGMKGQSLPDDYLEVIHEFLGGPVVRDGYGCSEQLFQMVRCPQGNFHPLPMTVPFLLDPETGVTLPRRGVQTGRYGFYNLMATAAWGGLVTADRVTIDWDGGCACGRKGAFLHPEVSRIPAPPDEVCLPCSGDQAAHERLQRDLMTVA